MSTFLGIGMGPIQTGIFIAGAAVGGINRIVIAEVDDKLRQAVHAAGSITINIAAPDRVYSETYSNVEVYNPNDEAEREKLIAAAAEAGEIATALPSIKFFQYAKDWLREGFRRDPERLRLVYTAENHNHAAEALAEAIGENFAHTCYLNTVVGKMSGVLPAAECEARGYALLAPGADRGHLVEQFNRIYISPASGVEKRKVANLYVKNDLIPFEEAKLYGHNAIHFWLGIHGAAAGKALMSDLGADRELLQQARNAFIDECGQALCRKYAGLDELFTPEGFTAYADDLLVRMTNPFLQDAISRIIRDLPRKLSWEDRVIGTMRMVRSQGLIPQLVAHGAALAAMTEFGDDPEKIKKSLAALWPQPWTLEHEQIWKWLEAELV